VYGPTNVPDLAQACPAAAHFAFASGLLALFLRHALMCPPQSNAGTGLVETNVIAPDATALKINLEKRLINSPLQNDEGRIQP
jgi:hypothetical protein